MLRNELARPELINLTAMYALADKMQHSNTAWIVTKDGQPVGTLGALLVPNIYNPDFTTLAELVWYVLPEHRNSRAAILLLEVFEKCAEDNADDAILSLLPTSKVRSLEKRGFKLCEKAYRKEYTWR